MARKNSKDRGLFEQTSGSGVWWICYFDAFGRRHREKAGSKGFARRLYEKRKTEIREARYFPPERRRPVMFGLRGLMTIPAVAVLVAVLSKTTVSNDL